MAPTAWPSFLVWVLGLIDPNKLLQPENTVTWVALFAKSGHWIPLRHGYEYTKKELNVCHEDDEGEDRVDLVEEQYNTAIENGEVIGEYVWTLNMFLEWLHNEIVVLLRW